MVERGDEFALLHENAEEAGLHWNGPPAVRRLFSGPGGQQISALLWGQEPARVVLGGALASCSRNLVSVVSTSSRVCLAAGPSLTIAARLWSRDPGCRSASPKSPISRLTMRPPTITIGVVGDQSNEEDADRAVTLARRAFSLGHGLTARLKRAPRPIWAL